jgi:hypothetical protein
MRSLLFLVLYHLLREILLLELKQFSCVLKPAIFYTLIPQK